MPNEWNMATKPVQNKIQNDYNMATEAVPNPLPNDRNMANKLVPKEINNDHWAYQILYRIASQETVEISTNS